jgi:hypothetical protein
MDEYKVSILWPRIFFMTIRNKLETILVNKKSELSQTMRKNSHSCLNKTNKKKLFRTLENGAKQ